MTAGAVLSMKLIEHFRPRYLIMPGIAELPFLYEPIETWKLN